MLAAFPTSLPSALPTADADGNEFLTEAEELNWLALRLVPGLGARRAYQLLERLQSPEAIFACSRSELEQHGMPPPIAQSIASGNVFEEAVNQRTWMHQDGVRLIPLLSPLYPARLREIYDPPTVLFAAGRTELLSSVCVAVVGTRRPTNYGKICSDRISRDLAATGVTVVSGMARGIDTAAHQGALGVDGSTVAVFGCGVDVIYPTENVKLASQIRQRGLLLSEFTMRTPGYPQNFPVRNRIVSGLSCSVVVIEGAQYSGSAITAKLAIDQGRDVFAVPGNITSKASWGPNLLIKQGAKLVQDAQDILEELSAVDRRRLRIATPGGDNPAAAQSSLFLGENRALGEVLMRLLPVDQPLHIDHLFTAVGPFSMSEVVAGLLDLELAGLVKQLPGRNFVRVWGVKV